MYIKTEIEKQEPGVMLRQMRVEALLPAAADERQFGDYREDAKRALSLLAEELNPLGVEQALAAALELLSTREGRDWLRAECRRRR